MKLRLLQLIVLIVGCLGLFFICYPDCLTVFNNSDCEKLHYRTSAMPEQTNVPVIKDSTSILSMADTLLMAI